MIWAYMVMVRIMYTKQNRNGKALYIFENEINEVARKYRRLNFQQSWTVNLERICLGEKIYVVFMEVTELPKLVFRLYVLCCDHVVH